MRRGASCRRSMLLSLSSKKGDVLFVGHGAVGTLLFCALSRIKIDRRFDQGSGGGGCWFGFDLHQRQPFQMWQPMEALISGG